ncbi:hypothetical protein FBEOM_10242 [Fusarium beomiforme]|uniref:Uncharacterized protein n=1 Tax=Fusarium beomiforme TaxID=44412 RepID=A0A9P5ACN9_9HYPO|nr:hypothetical protein FBEOM_10242 [Fusarium beomiforme]
MCIVTITTLECGNCTRQDDVKLDEEKCNKAIEEGKDCVDKTYKDVTHNELCQKCLDDLARGTCYEEPYEGHNQSRKKKNKEEKKSTGSLKGRIKKMIGN